MVQASPSLKVLGDPGIGRGRPCWHPGRWHRGCWELGCQAGLAAAVPARCL